MKTVMGTFQPITGHFRECLFLLAALLSDRWCHFERLAVKTNDMPYRLKLASGDLTSWVAGITVSWLESSWDHFILLPPSLQLFGLIVNFWCKLDLKGRATTIEIEWEPQQKEEGEGATGWILSSPILQLTWFPDVAYPSFNQRILPGDEGGQCLELQLSLKSMNLGFLDGKF